MIRDFMEPYPGPGTSGSSNPSSEGLNYFINYLNILEGVKSRIKNLHWAAKSLPVNEHKGAHEYLDDFLGIVSDFQDTVAESSQGILGHMTADAISGTYCKAANPLEMIKYLIDTTNGFYKGIPQEVLFVGIKAETETFIKDITKYKYLFELTE